MATSEEELNLRKLINQELDKEKKKQAESLDLSASLVDSVKEVLGINTKRTTADSNLLKVNKQINTQILNQKTGLGSISEINKRITKNQNVLNKGKVTERSLEKLLKGEKLDQVNITKEQTNLVNQIQSELDQELQLLQEGKLENLDNLRYLQESLKFHDNILDTQLNSLSPVQQQLLFTTLNVKELEKQNAEREKELALAEELQEKLGVAGKLNKLIGAIPGLGGAASKALKEVTEELERAAEANEQLPSKAKVAAMQFKALGKNLVKDLVDPTTLALGAITAIGKALMSVDKEAGEFAKNMGISYDESLALRSEMSKVSRNNKDILVTSKALVETQQSLNQFFGTTVQFSNQLASDLSILSKRTNMTAETQGLIALETAKTGKSALQLTKELNLQTFELNNQKGVQMSVKQIQDAIGKTAASLQLTFKGSSKELANQVVSARALGTNLAGVEKISSALLDFESSIQSELKAELLLGKNINLEKARQAALEGNMGKVAEEVMKNTVIMNAFETKNVIKQEAAAKALGLSRDELANMVLEQQKLETIRNFGAESLNGAQKKYNNLREQGLTAEQAAAQVGDEALANQLQTVSVAARFEAIMLRVQEIFIGMAEPILAAVDAMISLVGGAENFASVLMLVAAAYIGIRGAQAVNLLLTKKKKQEELQILGIKVGQATASVISNPLAAIAGLALAATVGSLIYGAIKGDDVMSKSSGLSGYGDRMLLGPEGAISLNNKDTVIAGTDLFKADDVTLSPEGTNTVVNNQNTTANNTVLITEVRTLININRQILAKSTTLEVDKQVMATTTENEMVKNDRVIQ